MNGGVFCLLMSPDSACGLQMVVKGYGEDHKNVLQNISLALG
nr:unnamed protein product [Callosobruchus chinensis]